MNCRWRQRSGCQVCQSDMKSNRTRCPGPLGIFAQPHQSKYYPSLCSAITPLPKTEPVGFICKRWDSVVHVGDGVDRRVYKLCILSELKNPLRSRDIWLQGSRQFKDFEEYQLPPARYTAQRTEK